MRAYLGLLLAVVLCIALDRAWDLVSESSGHVRGAFANEDVVVVLPNEDSVASGSNERRFFFFGDAGSNLESLVTTTSDMDIEDEDDDASDQYDEEEEVVVVTPDRGPADVASLPGDRVNVTSQARIGAATAAIPLETGNLFDDLPTGNVPRSRTSQAYTGVFEIVMANANYRYSRRLNSLAYLRSAEDLAEKSLLAAEKVWNAYEANSGGRLRFIDTKTGSVPQWNQLDTTAYPLCSTNNNRRLIKDLNATFGIGRTRADRKWAVLSRSARRGNGGGGKGAGVVAIVRNIDKPSLVAHEVNHNLGLGHAKRGRLDRSGRYTSYSPYASDFSLTTEGSRQLNGEIASCVEQHFLQWNADEDYQFIEFGKTMGLRNVGRGKSAGRTEPVSLVWENPYGGQHWFCYGVHGEPRASSLAYRDSFDDLSGITHEQTGPLTRKCAPLQDPFFYGNNNRSSIGTTGLVMHVEDKFDDAAGVQVRFEFDEQAFDMPPPLVELWTSTKQRQRQTIGTELWIYFRHRDDHKKRWTSTPYVFPLHYLKLQCGGALYTHNETVYTDKQQKELFEDFHIGVHMWPRRCARYEDCRFSVNKMKRQVKIDIFPAITEPTDCTLIVDKHKHLYKHVTLYPPP